MIPPREGPRANGRSGRRVRLAPRFEALELRTLLTGDGPRILAITPTEVRNTSFDHVGVTFDRDIDAATFSVADVAIGGPQGVVATGVQPLSVTQFRVTFPALTMRGSYQVAVGPAIADTTAHMMDQNQNGIQAEVPGDRFVASLNYVQADMIFTSPVVITEMNTSVDGKDIAIAGTTVTIDGPHNFHSVHLVDGAVLTHSANTASETHKLDLTVTDEIIVDASSAIDVSGEGYLPGYTAGNTTVGASTGGGAGSYGGLGGVYGSGTPNSTYGDYSGPDDWGSGTSPGGGGTGGGLVRIAAGRLILDGRILARGTERHGGGGSGGGISIAVATLSGAGSLDASGAVGNFGGGGRVAVYAADLGGFDTSRITAAGGTAYYDVPGGPGTVYIFQGVPHNHVKWYEPEPLNGTYVNAPISPLILKFSVPIEVSAANAANIVVDGQAGHHVATGLTQVADRSYQVDFPPLMEDGPYHFTVLNMLVDINGNSLDQNIIQIPGEPDDSDSFTLTVDTVPPRVTQHIPGGDIAGTIDHVDVWFSEAIDAPTFNLTDIAIVKPDGQTVAANGIQNVGLNRFRISFPAQTLVGRYDMRIGPDVRDLAGNPLDQDRDGNQGETNSDDTYIAQFNLVPVDLGLTNLVTPPTLTAGEPVTITWSGSNQTGTLLVGDWIDGVYLSTDATWDINDTRLALVPHNGGLAASQTYTSSASVVIPGALPGNYHILVRSDVANQERETNEANNLVASPPLPFVVASLSADGVPLRDSLTPSRPLSYFAVQVGPGESVDVDLDGLADTAVNELFIAFGAIPSPQSYHARRPGRRSRGEPGPAAGDHSTLFGRDALHPRSRR
ncbi:MAG: hypothetical protein JWN86_166 [Planctomycetota bacterium]|nr:hypothetical protein [Planctomycetota bacterium]